MLTAEAWLTVLYQDGEERLQCIHRTVPVSCRLDCPEDCRCLCTVRRQGEVYAAPAAGGVEVLEAGERFQDVPWRAAKEG